jgi:hypothetical protein
VKRTLRTQSQVEVNKNHCHCIYKLLNVTNDKIYRFYQILLRPYFGRALGNILWMLLALFRNATSLFQVRPVPKARHHPRHRRPGFLGLVPSCPLPKCEIISLLSAVLCIAPGRVTVGLFESTYARRFLLSQILPAKFHKWIARHGG